MALTDEKKDLLLGASIGETLQNADDNFTSLFDSVDELNEKMPTATSDLTNDSGFITKSVNNLTNYTVKGETGTDIELTVDADYKMTLNLKNSAGTVVSTATVDLPIESLVMNATYADGVLTLTLQNGTEVDVDISALISGLVPDTRTVNGKNLKNNITLTQDDVGNGTTYKRVKSGGDITINADGTITVNKVGGKTADEIGKVKDVTLNGTSVLDDDGTASLVIDDLTSEYTSVTASVSKAIGGTTYYGFNVAETDTAFEVYNTSGQQIVTQRVRADGNIFVACGTTSGGTFTVRKVGGGAVGRALYKHFIALLPNNTNTVFIEVINSYSSPINSLSALQTYATGTYMATGYLVIDSVAYSVCSLIVNDTTSAYPVQIRYITGVTTNWKTYTEATLSTVADTVTEIK